MTRVLMQDSYLTIFKALFHSNWQLPYAIYMLAFNKEKKILFLAIPPSNCTKPPHLSTKNGQDLCSIVIP